MVVINNRFEKSKGYSGNIFDIGSATKDGVVYPSLDPSIFELKFRILTLKVMLLGTLQPVQDIRSKLCIYFLTATEDTTLYEASESMNTGLDEILEVVKNVDDEV